MNLTKMPEFSFNHIDVTGYKLTATADDAKEKLDRRGNEVKGYLNDVLVPQVEENLNFVNSFVSDISINVKQKGIIEGKEFIDYTYSGTTTLLDGTTRQFIDNQNDNAKNNAAILQQILNDSRVIYFPQGDYVFCDYDETTGIPKDIIVPDNTIILGAGKGLTSIYGIRLRGATSNVVIKDITFCGLVDVTPPGKCKKSGTENWNDTTDFDIAKFNLLIKRPNINYATPLIFTPAWNNYNDAIENITLENVSFKNCSSGLIVGDHLGANQNDYYSYNVKVSNVDGENFIYHLVGLQKVKNCIFQKNSLNNSYIGMLLDSSRNSENIIFTNNIANKTVNLAKLESLSDLQSVNEICSNNIFISPNETDFNFNTDYVLRSTGTCIFSDNIIEINCPWDDIFSLTQSKNDISMELRNNKITINVSLKARNSICNSIFRIYPFLSNLSGFKAIIENNDVNIIDKSNVTTLRLIDVNVFDDAITDFDLDLIVKNNKINCVCECVFINKANINNLYLYNNVIVHQDGYFNFITLTNSGKNLNKIDIINNDIQFSRGCLLNANYFATKTPIAATKDIDIAITGNKYISKYAINTQQTIYTESNKTQLIHLKDFVDKINSLILKNNKLNCHENLIYVNNTSVALTINNIFIEDNQITFIGTRISQSDLLSTNAALTWGNFTGNTIVKGTYAITLNGYSKILYLYNKLSGTLTTTNILES